MYYSEGQMPYGNQIISEEYRDTDDAYIVTPDDGDEGDEQSKTVAMRKLVLLSFKMKKVVTTMMTMRIAT
jgi:hypothetical protein